MSSSFKNLGKLGQQLGILALPLCIAACAVPAPLRTSSPPQPKKQAPAPEPVTTYATPGISASTPDQEAEAKGETDSKADKAADTKREKSLHLNLVQTMIDQDNAYAALAHLDSYDQKWGIDNPSRQLRADSLRKTSQLDEAEQIYQSLLDGPKQVKAGPVWYGLGKVSIERGDLETAATRLEKSIQVDPLNVTAYSDLGLVYLLEGEKESAYDTLMKANQLGNGDKKVMANLALWGLVFDDFSMAMEIADKLQWSEKTRNQVMAQANTIKKRFDTQGISR